MNTTLGVRPRNKGFTLLELMAVLMVLAAMTAFAAPNFREYRRNAALTNTANTLVSSVYRARSDAMKDGVPAILMPGDANGPSGGDWTQGWIIFLDRDLDDDYGPADEIVFVQPGDEIPSDYLAIANSSSDGFVKFDGSGFPKKRASTGSGSTNAGFGALTLSVTRTDKTGDRYTRRVMISRSGRVRTCRPDVDGASNCRANSTS